jgi:tetratricopeptide (TPR) repeat protein
MRAVWIGAILIAAQPATAAVEVRGERFHVVGETDAATAVLAASHLEATADRLAGAGFHLRRPDLPVTVLIFSDQQQLPRFQIRSHGRAFAATAEDRHLIAIAWNAPGSPWLALAHEYAHLASDDRTMPTWFREGLAEYLSLQRDSEGAPIAPANAIDALSLKPWLGIGDLLDAQDGSVVHRHELFYAQSWLVVSWLATQPGAVPRRLESRQIFNQLALAGPAAVEVQLRAYAASLASQGPRPEESPRPLPELQARELDEREWQAWQLELLRGMKGNAAAEADLLALESSQPQSPVVQAALGALAIERGRFDEAEDRLRAASDDPAASALTRHRYALLLLRPTRDAPGPRAERAIAHAQRALELVPGKPEFLRTLAQANAVAGYWSRAAEVLLDLQAKQGWDAIAAEDFRELLRRRGQYLRAVDSPRIGPPAPPPAAPSHLGPSAPPALPEFVEAPLAPLRQPHDWPWPPPDTLIYGGRIAGVVCSSGEKRIVMDNPLFRVEFVESPKQPVKLHRPPLKWKTIPCGARGWQVNIAYVPYKRKGAPTGEARAILF